MKIPINFKCATTFYNDLGVKFAQTGFLDAAIYTFVKTLELSPQYADAHYNLGLAYWEKGLRGKALSEFKKVLRIDPYHYKARGSLAEIRKTIVSK